MFVWPSALHPSLSRRRRTARLDVERLEKRRLLDAAASAIISNGTIELGINPQGNLNAGRGTSSFEFETLLGLRFLPTGNEATSLGQPDEGWGVSGRTGEGSISGFVDVASLINQVTVDGAFTGSLSVVRFTSSADSAVSVVDIGSTLEVTHDFHPVAVTPNLYEITVTITNLTDQAIQDLRYRRVVDWDIPPTAFHEFVTINLGTTPPTLPVDETTGPGDRPAVLADSTSSPDRDAKRSFETCVPKPSLGTRSAISTKHGGF